MMASDVSPSSPPAWLDRDEYPFESRFFSTPAGRMHYVDEGTGDAFVFVHGVPTWSFLFRKLIRRLSDRYRCVAMDHLGFGLSDKPEGFAYEPIDLAQNVERLVESLDLERVILVVHDWGGPLGLPYAFHHSVRAVVLFNTWMWPVAGDRRASFLGRVLASPLYEALDDRYNASVKFFMPRAVASPTVLTPAVMRHYVEPLATAASRRGVTALLRAITAASPWLAVQWQQAGLLRRMPAMVAWGMRDIAFTKRDLGRWSNLLERGEIHRYERVGHFPPEEAGEDLSATLDAFARAIAA